MLVSTKKVVAFLSLLGLTWSSGHEFSGFKLFQAKPTSEEHRKLLIDMDEYFPEDLVDFWSDPNVDTVEFLVKVDLAENVENLLKSQNISYRIKVDDFQVVVDEQMRHIRDAEGEFSFRAPGESPNPRNDFDFFNYHRLDDIEDYITQVNSKFLNRFKVNELFHALQRYKQPTLTWSMFKLLEQPMKAEQSEWFQSHPTHP